LTQAALGGLVGRTEEWVSSVERGRRQVRRLDVLTELARELRIGLPDLLGEQVFDDGQDRCVDVSRIRAVLLAPQRLAASLFPAQSARQRPDPKATAKHVEHVWFAYQAGRLDRVLGALPSLIGTAGQQEGSGRQDRSGWAISARVHHLAATALSKVGQADLAWVAAQRAILCAEQADDPLVLASAARAGVHAFLAGDRYDDAMSLGESASGWLTERMDETDPAALSLLGRDANHWQTGFGPTNVELHRVAVALDLGDVSFVVGHGQNLPTTGVPPERAAAGLMHVGRALTLMARDEEALASLLDAEQVAPQLVRLSPLVRESVTSLRRRAPATSRSPSSALAGLADRCRVRV
jgi:transcriptional regulator with XRE-family HTH domain